MPADTSNTSRPKPYIAPLAVRARISRPVPKGMTLVNLGYNELPYGPTPKVAAAIVDAGLLSNRYGAPGCDVLRAALGQANGLDPETIICGNGSEELLDVIARNFVRPGDEILISQFGYIQFEMTANRLGATLIKAPETNFVSDVDALLAAVTDGTRLLFLANPNNPTGTVLSLDELARLVADMPDHVVVVLDLAYGEFSDPGYCAAVHQLALQHDRVVVTRTFSKAYGLAGLRVGWAQAPGWMLPGFYAARGMGSVNAMAQAAAVAALADIDVVQARVDEIVHERARVAEALAGLGVSTLPSGANFLLATIDGESADVTEDLVEYLFDNTAIIVNRTREAGLEHFMRFCLGLPEQNDLLIACIKTFLDQRKP